MQYNNSICLDLNGRVNNKIVQVKQCDDEGRVLHISLLKDGEPANIPLGSLVTFRVVRPDGFSVVVSSAGDYIACSGSEVTVVLKASMLAVEGNALADILITESEENLSSATFTMQINPSAYNNDQVTAEADFPVLQEIINQSSELISSMSESVAASAESAANAAKSEAAASQYLQEIQSKAADEKVKIIAVTADDSEGTVFAIPFTDDSSTHTGGLKMCSSILRLTGGIGMTTQLTIGNGQGTLKGNLLGKADRAGMADYLTSGSKIGISGAVTGTPTEFYGDEDITIPVTAVDPTKLSGSVPIAKGGTGATTAADALVNLGLSAAAAEINHCQGVTSNIQSQLDAILGRIKVVNKLPSDAEEYPNTIYLVIGNGGDAS